MPTKEEAKILNDAIFETLARDTIPSGGDSFFRMLMYHKFTGMPKRGMWVRIMPPVVVKTKEEWLALGVPESDLRKIKYVKCPSPFADVELKELWEPWWNTGQLFYEIAETRWEREDYEQRLAARKVQKWEWRMRETSRRKLARHDRRYPENAGLTERIEKFAYKVMGEIAAMIGPRENSWCELDHAVRV